MSAWSKQMPKGMHLKSEGIASSLSDPDSALTLCKFCEEKGLPYADTGRPVPLETFVSYGLEFQKRFVPALEQKTVVSLRQASAGFELRLDDGETLFARRIILAVGITQFAHTPAPLSNLPDGFVSHSSVHSDLAGFCGRRIAVVGAGASALDLAALLQEGGSSVEVIARSSAIRFHDPPQPRTLRDRISRPMTGIGAGWQLFFYCHAPRLFRLLPKKIRLDRVRKTLGPAPGWFVRDRVLGKMPLHVESEITGAKVENGRVVLEVNDRQGNLRTIEADHVIAATGYRVDLRRLNFLNADLCNKIRVIEGMPCLSDSFESSVSDLYFIGVAAANTFGPMMRFAVGAEFVARHLSRHLRRQIGERVQAEQGAERVQVLERT